MMTAAKMILHDWQRGKIPFFVPPPQRELPSEKPGVNEVENDTVIDPNHASAFRAIANVISSQQQMSVPVQRDLYNENELKGTKSEKLPGAEAKTPELDLEAETSEKSADSDSETSEKSEDSEDEAPEQSEDAEGSE